MNDHHKAATPVAQGQAPSMLAGWPALLVAALVIAAAVYSFSPRPKAEFPATQVHADRLLANGLAQQGQRLVTVGEQGQILIADQPEGPWHSAGVEPQRGSTLTQALFVGQDLALAVGHDGWILRSSDGGKTWTEVAFSSEGDPLLGLAGPYDGRLYAFGAFGLLLASDDQGQTWQQLALEIDGAGGGLDAAPAVPADPNADPFAAVQATGSSDDPFANFDAAAVGGPGHLNAMTQAADGSLILAGERGLLLKSVDRGQSWQRLPEVYAGSYFGVLALPSKTLITFGMRGHAYRSTDLGVSWQEASVPSNSSLFGGSVDARGQAVLVGAGHTVLISRDDGRTFELAAPLARDGLADLVVLPDGRWLTAGDAGVKLLSPVVATQAGDAS